MDGQLNRAQSCPCLRCCEGRSTGPGSQDTARAGGRVSGPQGQAQAGLWHPWGCSSGGGQMQEPQPKSTSREEGGEPPLRLLLFKSSQAGQGTFYQPASLERAKLPGAGGMLLPWHRPEPTAVLHHHQQKNACYKYGKWMYLTDVHPVAGRLSKH